MNIRLFAAKLQNRWETGCAIKIFACTNEDANILNYLQDIGETMFKNIDEGTGDYVSVEEIKNIDNCGEDAETYPFVANMITNFLSK